MYSSKSDYKKYIQQVLEKSEVKKIKNLNIKNLYPIKRFFRVNDKKRIEKYIACSNIRTSSSTVLKIFLEQIEKYYSSEIDELLKNIEIDVFLNQQININSFKSYNNYYTTLLSTGLIQLLYNNLCFLEAISMPENVESTSIANPNDLLSHDYMYYHSLYILECITCNIVTPVIFEFYNSSQYMVNKHLEFIIVFILFHELAHILNGDLKKTRMDADLSIDKSALEFRADEKAIDLMINNYLAKQEFRISKYNLVRMLEYYLFRLLNILNVEINDNYPNTLKRVLNIVDYLIVKYNEDVELLLDYKEFIQNEHNEFY